METRQHRMTRQRKVILDTLKRLKTHPTADELFGLVRKKLPKISLGTVYRNLELLTEQGVIRKLETAGAQKRFDGDVSPHYHIKCVRCGKIDDLMVQLPEIDPALAEDTRYEVLDVNLEFLGVCPKCQQKQHGRRSNS